MSRAAKALWAPGLLTVFLSVVSYRELSRGLGWEVMLNLGPLMVYVRFSYLLSLPFIGALGAFLSSHGGGLRRDRLLAALFPALWQLAYVVTHVVQFAMGGLSIPWNGSVSMAVGSALIPGVALFVGALPFVRTGRPHPNTHAAGRRET
jgi:cell division protein FtsX